MSRLLSTISQLSESCNKKEDVSKIEIWSSLGELIYKSNYLPETLTLEHYSKGLYLVKIYKEDKVQIEKIILN